MAVFWKIMMMTVAPSRPRPTVNMPATPPVRKATCSAVGHRARLGRGGGAHVAPRGQRHADEAGEAGHDAADDEGQRAGRARQAEAQRLGAVRLA